MKLVQLVVVLGAVACARAGLLRVPRVYNALISTNQRLAPSRADTVSFPVVAPVALPLVPAAAAIVAEERAPPPAHNQSSGNHTVEAGAALVAPLAVYSPYYYSAYSYHYNPFLLPPPAPLLHYGYSYLPLALAHPVPATGGGDAQPEAKSGGGDALPDGAKVDAGKDAVSVEAN